MCISETKNNDLKKISETINSLKHFLNWRLNDNYKNIFEDDIQEEYFNEDLRNIMIFILRNLNRIQMK